MEIQAKYQVEEAETSGQTHCSVGADVLRVVNRLWKEQKLTHNGKINDVFTESYICEL